MISNPTTMKLYISLISFALYAMAIANIRNLQNLYELLGPPGSIALLKTLANLRPQVMTVTRIRTRSQHHLQR